MTRPEPGSIVLTERRYHLCGECGHAVDNGLCSLGCLMDGHSYRPSDFYAVYEATEKFVRDEPARAYSSIAQSTPVLTEESGLESQ